MLLDKIWSEEVTPAESDLPVIAFAIHDGHLLRDDVVPHMALGGDERRREEDPFTGDWTTIAPTRVVGLMSRFQVDLNRPREKSVYLKPEDAWGLQVWKNDLPDPVATNSLKEYDAFYKRSEEILSAYQERFGKFVVYDLHSYNHRRDGATAPPADPAGNPQVNVGTGTMDRQRWAPVIDRFITDLAAADFPGGNLDVRENVKFQGGNFGRWAHSRFPESACVLSIEFKKFFMDEWSGDPDPTMLDAIPRALESTLAGVSEVLATL